MRTVATDKNETGLTCWLLLLLLFVDCSEDIILDRNFISFCFFEVSCVPVLDFMIYNDK